MEVKGTLNPEGYLIITHPTKLWLKCPDLAGKRVKLTLKETSKRSTQQNSYYWGVVIELIHAELTSLGNEVDVQGVHEWLLMKFNYKEMVNESTGEVERIPQRSKTLSKSEFFDYVEKVRKFAAEFLNLYIPDPYEQLTAL